MVSAWGGAVTAFMVVLSWKFVGMNNWNDRNTTVPSWFYNAAENVIAVADARGSFGP
jgi:hypothetical protein